MDFVAGQIQPTLQVVGRGTQPLSHRPLLRDLEREHSFGALKNSELAPLVIETLRKETGLELAKPYDSNWIITGICQADFYFTPIRLSAGQRDWQRDFAKTATPILVGVSRSLQRSADAHAVIIQLCEVIAQRLRLKLIWPDNPDDLNDAKNALYRACLDSHEVESDEVLIELQGLTIIGPS